METDNPENADQVMAAFSNYNVPSLWHSSDGGETWTDVEGNPFNPATTIEYQVPRRSHVQLSIFDLSGRKIRTLVNGEVTAGVHRINWDSRDDFGDEVASGIYLYKMASEGYIVSRKLALVR